jgi:hypothetical protein
MAIDADTNQSEEDKMEIDPADVEIIAIDETPIDHEVMIQTILRELVQSTRGSEERTTRDREEHTPEQKAANDRRLEIGIDAISKLLIEFKTASGVRINQIEFIDFEKENGLYVCRLDGNRKVFERIEHAVRTDTIDDLMMTSDEIKSILDMVSRVCLTRVNAEKFDSIEGYRNNVKNVLRRGMYMRMKNLHGLALMADLQTQDERNEYRAYISRVVVELYLVCDVFCVLTVPHKNIEEFRYFLQRDSDYRSYPLIRTPDDLNRMSDIIYYHSLDSNMMVDKKCEEDGRRIEKDCRCRHQSFMPNNSISALVSSNNLGTDTIFDRLVRKLGDSRLADIDQIDLIKNVVNQKEKTTDPFEKKGEHYTQLKALVTSLSATHSTERIKIQNKIGRSYQPIQKDVHRSKSTKSRKQREYHRNYAGHNFNIRRQKGNLNRTADSDTQWRSR